MNRKQTFSKINLFLRSKGAKKVAIFGSYAIGKQKKNSDIDILVNFNDSKSIFEIVSIQDELGDLLNKKIDLVTEKSVSPYIIDKIKKEMVIL